MRTDFTHPITALIFKQLTGAQMETYEHDQLTAWRQQSPENEALFLELTNEVNLAKDLSQVEESKKRIQGRLRAAIPELRQAPVRRIVWRYAAVAAVLLFIAISTYLLNPYLFSSNSKVQPSSLTTKVDIAAPTGSKAILTLANGDKILLDSTNDGILSKQGISDVRKQHGEIAYLQQANNSHLAEASTEVAYNSIATDRGGTVRLSLPDGSKVWLNSSSRIRFPTSFRGNERKVEIMGEAYFEVTHNSRMPFKVLAGGQLVEVLGTSFDINSYSNAPSQKTTLIEGSVKVTAINGSETNQRGTILKPGQQASYTRELPNTEVQVINNVDIESVVAWKNGLFLFKGVTIQTIMQDIARWYDVEIEYQGQPINKKFHAEIPRNSNVSAVFESLEGTGSVHFKIEGRKIVVLP